MNGKLGLFRLADAGYAVPIRYLLRVLEKTRPYFLPLIPQGLAGMLVVDGEIVPLVDSCWLPEVSAGKSLAAEFKVLVATEYGTVALPADLTVGVVAVERCGLVRIDEVPGFLPEAVSYRQNNYLVLNVDAFTMGLIRLRD